MSQDDGHAEGGPDLVGLLAGELGRSETLAAARHLDGCADCAAVLVDLVVAHAALRSSDRVQRTLDDAAGVTAASPPVGGADASALGTDGTLPPLPELDDPGPGPVPVPATAGRAGRAVRAWRRPATVAAAVVVALGVVVGVVAVRHGGPTPSPVASAPLHPLSAPPAAGGAVAVFASGTTRSLTVDAADLPAPAPQTYYEVWLLDPGTGKMLPMGVLAPSGRGSYSVSAGIMAGYSAVDVSLQANDGDPAHSRTSVLRAYL